jgi:SAM-dependent methyltransferase
MYPPPATHDPEALALLREALGRAGYLERRIAEAIGLEKLLQRRPIQVPAYERMLPPGEPLSTLVRLFLLRLPVPREDAAGALAPLPVERAAEIGVVAPVAGGIEACLELVEVDGRLIASDPTQQRGHTSDHVLGLTPASLVLDALVPRRPVGAALDLGTGSGLLALQAARHAERVVAADINARALRFVEFNAVLNDVQNVEVREGSMFEPVEGETFDLIVCNPPYYISPAIGVVFRDSGLLFCEELVRRLPPYLAEGGFAVVIVSWVHGAEDAWAGPLASWVAGSGCDALLLRYRTWEPLAYAADLNRTEGHDPDAFGEAIDRWLDYYADLAIERISWGTIVLRRRSGAENWTWAHDSPAAKIDPATEHLMRLFEAQDYLRGVADRRALLEETVALAAEHLVEQSVRIGAENGAGRTMLSLRGGLRFQVEIDDPALALLSQLDGREPLGETLARLDPGDGPPLADSALPMVARLLELGFLVRTGARAAR